MRLLCTVIFFIPFAIAAQKQVYIPIEWQQPNGLDYSFDRSAASGNFIIFWGPLAGTDPTQASPDIAFDPQFILNTAEELYRFYIDTIQFVNDDEGLLSDYKIILVMLHTWTGLEGWAFGGNYDGIVGAMWMHPHAASSGPTLAHEFTHTLQNYAWMLNPGHGFIDSSYVGFFWETHAEFMALQRYPSVALEFDMARWLNTCQFHWSSTRHHYQAFIFLQFIKELDGIGMINRMWNESNIGEHPLETFKRLKGIDQEELNDLFADYAMRNVNWDYAIGDLLRQRIASVEPKFVSHPTIIPEAVDTSRGWYRIPNHLAPQDYGYNIIELHPKQLPGCDKRFIHLRLEGQHLVFDHLIAGWRFGLVALDEAGQTRFSPVYAINDEILFELEDDEIQLFLVVTGAPKEHHNYAWEIGFPKIYRFPYEFRISNAWPEGYQPGYRNLESGITGAPHMNGGGFVASTAIVEPTAWVGPDAQVRGHAQVRGAARIDGFAIVKDNALIQDSAQITGHAIVGEDAHVFGHALIAEQAHVFGGCNVYDSAVVKGNTLIFQTSAYERALLKDNTFCWGADLHGDITLGGDAEFFSECSDGTYLQVEWAYDRHCDGIDNHPANSNLTFEYQSVRIRNQYTLICDTLVTNSYRDTFVMKCERDTFNFFDTMITTGGVYDEIFLASNGGDSVITLWLGINPMIHFHYSSPICWGDTLYFHGQPVTIDGPFSFYLDTLECGALVEVSLFEISPVTDVVQIENTLYVQNFEDELQWYDCTTGLPIPGATGQEFTPSVPGIYRVKATSPFGCEAFSSCYTVSTVSTQALQKVFQFQIQPNPAKDFLNLVLEVNAPSDLMIEIFDMTGHRHFKRNLSVASTLETIDVLSLSSGAYVIKISNSAGQFSTRIFNKI